MTVCNGEEPANLVRLEVAGHHERTVEAVGHQESEPKLEIRA